MYEELVKCRDLLTQFGGHPMAAGLSMEEKNVEAFRRRLNENCTLTEQELIPKIMIDVPMPVDYVTMELINEFSILEPYGKDNSKPVFADRNLSVSRMWILGKNRNVLKLSLKSSQDLVYQAIYFGDVETFIKYMQENYGESMVKNAFEGKTNNIVLSIVYSPKINIFRETVSLQFEILYYE